ncbi:hypothetical protein V2J09_021602 [Rumex salicifolius]
MGNRGIWGGPADDIANCLDIDLSLHSPAIANTVEGRAGRLRNALLHRGRFLLVLDSVWQPLYLDEIGIPELVSGRKLIITSRIRSLLNKIDASKKIFEVQPLSNVNEAWELFKKEMGFFREDDVWELFKKKMGSYCEDERVSSIIKSILLDQLDGLPLAIYELADTFLSDDIIQEDYAKLRFAWRKEVGCSLATQPSFHMELRDTELSHRFKDSYENLDEVTRDCFLHATLLPKDNVIQSKEMIVYWMWKGLLGDDFETLEEGIEKGRQILNQLKNAHLLESVTTQYCPQGIENMKKLRQLDLSQTKLATFPAKVVGQLTELEELLMITDNGCVWGSSKHEQWEGACVEELVGLGKLAVLDLHFLDATAFDMYVNEAEKRANLPPKFCFCVRELQNGTSAGQSSVNIIMLSKSTSELQLMVCDEKLKLEGRLRDLDVLECSDLEYLFQRMSWVPLRTLGYLK